MLRNSYGVMVYQEQVMETAVVMAGFSMGEADTLRKAMGKKKLEVLMPFKQRFIDGAASLGHDRRLAGGLFDMIVPFADYGFNASHACAYGYVSYQTAYLMAHHPVEYMAAILTSVKDDKNRKPFYLYACRGMGIDVLPPDVNESDMEFAPAPGERRAIRFGLSAVRNVGEGAVRSILEARAAGGHVPHVRRVLPAGGPFGASRNACSRRSSTRARSSRSATRGAGCSRSSASSPPSRRSSGPIAAERKAEAAGQFSLFGGRRDGEGLGEIDEDVLQGPEMDKRLLLSKEKEMLGQFVTDHPLLGIEDADARADDARRADDRGPGRRRPRHGRRDHRRVRAQVHEAGRAVRAVPARGARRAASTWSRSRACSRPCPS